MPLRVGIRRVNIRFDAHMGEHGTFLARCDDCITANEPAYWPLTKTYWNPGAGLQRCRACHQAKRRAAHAAKIRRAPEFMLARSRRYYAKYRDKTLARRRAHYAQHREEICAKRNAKRRAAHEAERLAS